MARLPDGTLIGAAQFSPIAIEGGGYVTGFNVSNDGETKVCNTDVFNGYALGSADTGWRMLFTSETLPEADYDPIPNNGALTDGLGCFAACVAPGDNTRVVAGWNGFFYFSDDTGGTFARGSLTAKRLFANTGAQRYWNDKIAISPANADHVLMGTTNDGVYYTTDFGATISAVNGTIPTNNNVGGQPSPYLVAIAANGTDCYIFVQGTGLYSSTAGVGGAFTAVSGGPDYASSMIVDALGAVWVADPTSGTFKYESSSWTEHTLGLATPLCVAVNPNDTDQMVACNSDGFFVQSLDRGATKIGGEIWQPTYPSPNGLPVDAAGDVEWLNDLRMYPGKIMFNPAETNEMWCSHGLGVAYSTPPTTFVVWQWYSLTRGIFELVNNNFLAIPGSGALIVNMWDKPNWHMIDLEALYEEPIFTGPGQTIEHAWQSDYASNATSYVLVAQGFANDTSGYSENAGASYVEVFPGGWPVPAEVGGNGGACAVNERNQQVIIPGNNQKAICTEDDWATWDYFDPPNEGSGSGVGYWINASYNRRNCVTADKETPGTFACVMSNAQGSGNQGLWYTTTGPTGSWTQAVVGRIDSEGDPSDFWACRLAYIPGKAGELLYATRAAASWPDSRLLHFTDNGDTGPTALGGFEGVIDFGFGKSEPGQSYPTIFVMGTLGGVSGLYMSTDFFATTALLLARFPCDRIDTVNAVAGDPNIFGRVYVGYVGSAAIYGDFVDRREQT